MYIYRCTKCQNQVLKDDYLAYQRCAKCGSICRLEAYDKRIVLKHKLLGNCVALTRVIGEAQTEELELSVQELSQLKVLAAELGAMLEQVQA